MTKVKNSVVYSMRYQAKLPHIVAFLTKKLCCSTKKISQKVMLQTKIYVMHPCSSVR